MDSTQERTFCKWLNTKLEANGYPPMRSLVQDLCDGVRLIQLMPLSGDTSLGRYNKNPRMRVQKAENVNKALEFIRQRGIKLTNIGPEDIIDGNLKLILGMIWTLVLRFTIADISEEGLSAKEGLLLWCQRKTAPYKEVDVQDFSVSWSDGLALSAIAFLRRDYQLIICRCALIHCHRPDLLDYDKLDKVRALLFSHFSGMTSSQSDRHRNTRLAFQVAADHLGIPQLLEVEDLCDSERPDERSVMTYIASFFHAFSTMDQAETVSRRVEKFAELMQSLWTSKNDYERRARNLLRALTEVQEKWAASKFTGTYVDAKEQSSAFTTYKQTTKRIWVTERQDVTTLFGNIQTKLKTYGLREYVPPVGLALSDIDIAWNELLASEAKRSRSINAQIRQIKESLRKKFADIANDFSQRLHGVSLDLASVEGPLEIVSRNMTNLTPARLEQFESTFRYFDRDETNTLILSEFTAALASLGIIYSRTLSTSMINSSKSTAQVTFEPFINLLVEITEDQTSQEQLRDSFRGIAGDKPFVTELDMRLAQLPVSAIDYLREVLPSSNNEVDEPEYDYEAWLHDVFVS
ncbi:actinin-like protein [Chiua virens]|nr:actinin-like protein [Chiua virens]